MPAHVKIDAFPGRLFDGRLVKIGILPDGQSSQLNPDLKLYKCEIECDFRDAVIRPGMSCDVELVKESYDQALYIPVQCVVRVEGVPRVYVKEKNEWKPRNVRVGLDNNRMIHILNGLRAGEEVMLAPPVKEEKSEFSEPAGSAKKRAKEVLPPGVNAPPPVGAAKDKKNGGAPKKTIARPEGVGHP